MPPAHHTGAHWALWGIAAASTVGVIVRPWRIAEAWWALGGALLLVTLGLLPVASAAQAVAKGTDVYLFLTGMMMLAELARREGLFEHLAARAVRASRGSAKRLFALVYAIGTLVTVFMSNDATAVVLTPAVYAAARQAGVKPLPYLFACAFIANAASFVLPISNPANLVIFGEHLPALLPWLGQFGLPSVAAIGITYAALRWLHREPLRARLDSDIALPPLSPTGRLAGIGIVAVALALVAASAAGLDLGAPTLATAALAVAAVLWRKRESPRALLGDVSWSVLVLVAGLFVLVEGLAASGVIAALTQVLHAASTQAPGATAWGAGTLVALACNVMNNLPAGLIAGSVAAGADVPLAVRSALAIGIDLGPNLSVTGSLATLLWLIAIRREGENVSAGQFLRAGAIVMPTALLGALAVLALQTH